MMLSVSLDLTTTQLCPDSYDLNYYQDICFKGPVHVEKCHSFVCLVMQWNSGHSSFMVSLGMTA